QLRVDGAVPPGNPLAAHAVARDDALPFEQQLGERATVGLAAEEALGPRPAADRRAGASGPPPREPPRPPFGTCRVEPALRPQGLPGVVRHLTGPDEIPEGSECLAAL